MLRRLAIILIASKALASTDGAPTDIEALNAVARHFNEYIAQLQSGVVNLKQWARVVRAWKRLVGEK